MTIAKLLMFVSCVGLLARAEDAWEQMTHRVTEHTLSNGLKLLILPRHDAPVFSFVTVVNAGSVDNPGGQTGIAHLMEHMAFKGTSRVGTTDYEAEAGALNAVDEVYADLRWEQLKGRDGDPERIEVLAAQFKKAQEEAAEFVETNEFVTIVERFGGVNLNAGTAHDFTMYYYSLPSNKLELFMSLESERFLDPVLREFYKEREVVKEERRMRLESSPVRTLLEEVQAAAYKAHPYGVDGLGHMSDLNYVMREQALAFFKRYYVPSNMVIALVGDVSPDEVISLAETYWGRIPSGEAPSLLPTQEPPQRAERRVTVYGPAQRVVLYAYHIPDNRHPDWPVLEAISSVLSNGRTSRLHRRLVQDEQAALAAGGMAGFPGSKYPCLFIFFAMPSQGVESQTLIDLMDEEIEKLRTQPISEEELARVKVKARASLIRGLSSDHGLALQLALTDVLQGDWRELFSSAERIKAITAEDIQRVADEVFNPRYRTVGLYETQAQGGEQ